MKGWRDVYVNEILEALAVHDISCLKTSFWIRKQSAWKDLKSNKSFYNIGMFPFICRKQKCHTQVQWELRLCGGGFQGCRLAARAARLSKKLGCDKQGTVGDLKVQEWLDKVAVSMVETIHLQRYQTWSSNLLCTFTAISGHLMYTDHHWSLVYSPGISSVGECSRTVTSFCSAFFNTEMFISDRARRTAAIGHCCQNVCYQSKESITWHIHCMWY